MLKWWAAFGAVAMADESDETDESDEARWLAEALTVRGYVEARGSWTDAAGTPWTTTERLRPTAELELVPRRLQLFTTLEARLDQGRYNTGEVLAIMRDPVEGSLEDLSGEGPSLEQVIDDCAWQLDPTRTIDEIRDVLSVERLYVDIQLPRVDIRLGRQSVNWGSALFFNPTDVFFQILLTEPWQERAGIDAGRFIVPIGDNGLVSGLVAVLDDPGRVQGALKGTTHVGAADLSALVSTDGADHSVGLDFQGDLRGPVPLGWWVEGSYDGDVRVAAGVDYSFAVLNRLYIAGQVYHDGSGAIPTFYDWNARQDPVLSALTPCPEYPELELPAQSDETRLTLGRWYGLASVRLEINDDLTLDANTVVNVVDGTGLAFPTVAYQAGGRLTLNAGVQVYFGSDGEFQPPPRQLQPIRDVDLSPLVPSVTGLAWARLSL
ncbi:MAG: hypothetical protein AAFV53_36685 [Myxococcota bacterium]